MGLGNRGRLRSCGRACGMEYRGPVLVFLMGLALLSRGGAALSSLCFEMLSQIDALYLQEHPARGRVVVAEQTGQLTLHTLPAVGSGKPMVQISTYLDLSQQVVVRDETGLLGFAFHPKFAANGRIFVSYICDSNAHPSCKAPCACNSGVQCYVGQQGAGCHMVTVIAEYSAGRRPLQATRLNPVEIRRILTFARPYSNHNGGQIWFGKDGYLYYSSGDGGSEGDPWNLSQNGHSWFGKIFRLDVDRLPRGHNFSVPSDNPFLHTSYNPLMYALGLRNPWRCHHHPVTGLLVCGDVGGSIVEEINVISSAANYEWANYEGTLHNKGTRDLKQLVGRATGPLFTYTHASLGYHGCVIGGVFHTANTNKCLMDKYIYADHSGCMWLSNIGRSSSTRRVSYLCASNSPIRCPTSSGYGTDGAWGPVTSWATDLSGNAYFITDYGIFRLTYLKSCGLRCRRG